MFSCPATVKRRPGSNGIREGKVGFYGRLVRQDHQFAHHRRQGRFGRLTRHPQALVKKTGSVRLTRAAVAVIWLAWRRAGTGGAGGGSRARGPDQSQRAPCAPHPDGSGSVCPPLGENPYRTVLRRLSRPGASSTIQGSPIPTWRLPQSENAFYAPPQPLAKISGGFPGFCHFGLVAAGGRA